MKPVQNLLGEFRNFEASKKKEHIASVMRNHRVRNIMALPGEYEALNS